MVLPAVHDAEGASGLAAVLGYISKLGLDDIDSIRSRSSGRAHGTDLSDEELALRMFAEEAESLLNTTKDYIAGSAGGTQSLLQQLMEMEEMARYDHEVALALSEERPIPPKPVRGNATRVIDLTAPLEDADAEPPPVASTSRSTTASTSRVSPKTSAGKSLLVDCTICADPINGTVVHAPCGHAFDTGCLRAMFRKATVDESLFPPTCCARPFSLSKVREHLEAALVSTYEKKAREFSTINRVYCYQPSCATFIGPSTDGPSHLRCPECVESTCGFCREKAHVDRKCSAHLDQIVLDLGKEKGWRQCYYCHHLVELTQGCYHMICLCKGQFCYLCGAPWKGCACPRFATQHIIQE